MTTEQFLDALHKILRKNGKYAAPSSAEKEIGDPLEEARLLLDLGDVRGAKKRLHRQSSAEACLILARIARRELDWRAHQKAPRQDRRRRREPGGPGGARLAPAGPG